LRKILDPRGEFYHDGHLVPRQSASTLWGAESL
jgi:hypothetical protein